MNFYNQSADSLSQEQCDKLESLLQNYHGEKGKEYAEESFKKPFDDASPSHKFARDLYCRQLLRILRKKKFDDKLNILDFGCGTAKSYEWFQNHYDGIINFWGVEMNEDFVQFAQNQFPDIQFLNLKHNQLIERIPPSDLKKVNLIISGGALNCIPPYDLPELFNYFFEISGDFIFREPLGNAYGEYVQVVKQGSLPLFAHPYESMIRKTEYRINTITSHETGNRPEWGYIHLIKS